MTSGSAGTRASKRRLTNATAAETFSPACSRELERCGAADEFHDYILSPYEPRRPAVGKLRSVNLLYESFASMGVEQEGCDVVDRVRTTLGPFRTVWGVKLDAVERTTLGWELYFYDFERAHADLSIGAMCEALHPLLRVDAEEPWALPWHMFSIEFDVDALKGERSVAAHLYIDMRSYGLRGRELTFENVYTFHDPASEIRDVLRRIRSCAHLPEARVQLGSIMPQYLFRCGKLCVAHKRHSDALYFSRIPTRALVRFTKRQMWPSPESSFVRENADELDHLLWDVGLDIRLHDGEPRTTKIGLYGSF